MCHAIKAQGKCVDMQEDIAVTCYEPSHACTHSFSVALIKSNCLIKTGTCIAIVLKTEYLNYLFLWYCRLAACIVWYYQ